MRYIDYDIRRFEQKYGELVCILAKVLSFLIDKNLVSMLRDVSVSSYTFGRAYIDLFGPSGGVVDAIAIQIDLNEKLFLTIANNYINKVFNRIEQLPEFLMEYYGI